MSTTNELPPGLTETNRDREMAWSIDVQADPYAIDLELLNPAHNELFRSNNVLPYLRAYEQKSRFIIALTASLDLIGRSQNSTT